MRSAAATAASGVAAATVSASGMPNSRRSRIASALPSTPCPCTGACATGAGMGDASLRSRKRRCSARWRIASIAVSVPSRKGTPTSASGRTISGSTSAPANELNANTNLSVPPASFSLMMRAN